MSGSIKFNDVAEEVNKYFCDASSKLSSLSNYPPIRQLYIALNSGLPASVVVERLFSLGSRVFAPLRSSEQRTFESDDRLFLRAAK